MKTVQISLNSIDKVKSFVNDITKFDYDFDLVSGRYVVDAKSSDKRKVKAAINDVERNGGHVMGVVLNKVESASDSNYGYGYGYGYGGEDNGKKKKKK